MILFCQIGLLEDSIQLFKVSKRLKEKGGTTKWKFLGIGKFLINRTATTCDLLPLADLITVNGFKKS